MAHSPEPWHIGEMTCLGGGANHIHINDANEVSIFGKAGLGTSNAKAVRMLDADAERIVACVNACSGIKTEVLASMGALQRSRFSITMTKAVEMMELFGSELEGKND